MKTKLIALALALVMLLSFAACTGTKEEGPKMARGVWTDNVWTSEIYALKLTLPAGWSKVADSELGQYVTLNGDYGAYMPADFETDESYQKNGFKVCDFYASGDWGNIIMYYTKNRTKMTETQILANIKADINSLHKGGDTPVVGETVTKTVGERTLTIVPYTIFNDSERSLFGMYVEVDTNIMRVYGTATEGHSYEEIIAMFSAK